MSEFLFGGWKSLERVLVVGVPAYVLLLVLLRVFGKHALAKNNAYGLVVTVSLGSALASAVLTRQVTLADAALVFALMLGLQYVLAWLLARFSSWPFSVLTQSPAYVVKDGKMLRDCMLHERISPQEVYAAVRKAGLDSVESVSAMVLEADGTFSVIEHEGPTRSALCNVSAQPESLSSGWSRQARHSTKS